MRSKHDNYHNKHNGTVGAFFFIVILIITTISCLSFFLIRSNNENKAKDITIKNQDSIISSLKNLPPKEVEVHDTIYLEPPKVERKPFKLIPAISDTLSKDSTQNQRIK